MMDTVNSFKGYDKVDEAENQALRKKTRKRIAIIAISAVVLIAVVVGAVVGIVVHKKSSELQINGPSTSSAIQAVCSTTQYKDACTTSLASMQGSNKADPKELFKLTLQIAIDSLSKISSFPDSLADRVDDKRAKAALSDCKSLFEDAIDNLNDSLSSMLSSNGEKIFSSTKIEDVRTWLSSSLTNQETCLDGLSEISPEFRDQMQDVMKNSTEFASNSLAIATKILTILHKLDIPFHRRLLADDFPAWISSKDRKLLQEAVVTPDVVVAQDGSGKFKTIAEAVATVPNKSKKRYVIYVKAGKYKEKVELDKAKWNVMMYGDGPTKTIITGSLNFRDGTQTFATATFVAAGRGFIGKDIGFENTAGPGGHQAVAVRCGSDQSVFYRCSFDGYQDTLYAHSNRQFYRDCNITGTVDFIFGNAAVVFQGCNILPRQPAVNQQVILTAQGKKDPNQNTGISIHQCQLSALGGNITAPTYLGRPWKEYSTTVIMQSTIGSFLHPAGWLSWAGDNSEPPSTIFYAEYLNTGPGSDVSKRVKWAGYKSSISSNQASQYTVDAFIQGSEWLQATGVQYTSNL